MNTDYQRSKQYLDYMHTLEQKLGVLDRKTREDISNELASHIYESMCTLRDTMPADGEALNKVLAKLGSPAKIARLYVSEARLRNEIKKGNPFQIVRYAGICIFRTGRYLISGLFYLFSITFLVLSLLKLFIPDNIGLFCNDERFFVGYSSAADPSMHDILGYWFIPAALVFAGLLYWIGTILIKRDMLKR